MFCDIWGLDIKSRLDQDMVDIHYTWSGLATVWWCCHVCYEADNEKICSAIRNIIVLVKFIFMDFPPSQGLDAGGGETFIDTVYQCFGDPLTAAACTIHALPS